MKNVSTKIRYVIFGLVLILGVPAIFFSLYIADIRPPEIEENGISKEMERKGNKLMLEMLEAHGIRNWQKIKTAEYTANSSWYGFFGSLGCPWPETDVDIHYKMEPNTFNIRVEFLNTESKGEVWGIQSWKSYIKEPGQELLFKENTGIKFGLSTSHYLTELPFRIAQAPIKSYAGERERNKKTYLLVYATWEKAAPHALHDQYVLWINKETKLLELAQYTIREGGKFASAWVIYEDYQAIEGVMMPTAFHNKLTLDKEDYLHRHVYKKIRFNSFDITELRPNDVLPPIGDNKYHSDP
ncbi:hypothetical protein WIW50_05050 [Flavobacteriaceae bacterium 3-367]